MPDHGFGRCDGYHEMVEFRISSFRVCARVLLSRGASSNGGVVVRNWRNGKQEARHKPFGRHRARFIIPAHWSALRTTSKPHSQPRRQTDQFIGSARNSALSPAKSFGACDGFPTLPALRSRGFGPTIVFMAQHGMRISPTKSRAERGHFSRTLLCSRAGRALYSSSFDTILPAPHASRRRHFL